LSFKNFNFYKKPFLSKPKGLLFLDTTNNGFVKYETINDNYNLKLGDLIKENYNKFGTDVFPFHFIVENHNHRWLVYLGRSLNLKSGFHDKSPSKMNEYISVAVLGNSKTMVINPLFYKTVIGFITQSFSGEGVKGWYENISKKTLNESLSGFDKEIYDIFHKSEITK
jgi:hypothetical protein